MNSFTARDCSFKRQLIRQIVVLLVLLSIGGCNFFGRKKDEGDGRKVGELAGGQMVVGTYSFTYAQTTPTTRPNYAETETYIFDPNSSVRIEIRDQHNNGASCTAYGQYRIVGEREVFIYLQAISPSNCPFSPVIHMSNVQIGGQYLRYEDPTSRQGHYLFRKRTVPQTLTGLWSFGGQGGIDYIVFDQNGYFLLQLTDNDGQYLLIGYYTLSSGQVALQFFSGMNPAVTPYGPIPYAFATDGSILQFTEQTDNGPVSFFGQKL